jgi:hypothetical protein
MVKQKMLQISRNRDACTDRQPPLPNAGFAGELRRQNVSHSSSPPALDAGLADAMRTAGGAAGLGAGRAAGLAGWLPASLSGALAGEGVAANA